MQPVSNTVIEICHIPYIGYISFLTDSKHEKREINKMVNDFFFLDHQKFFFLKFSKYRYVSYPGVVVSPYHTQEIASNASCERDLPVVLWKGG